MTDILVVSTWSALKWVVLVLIAGFIGQFGRMTAEAITEKIRLRRAGKNPLTHGPQNPEEPKALSTGAVGKRPSRSCAGNEEFAGSSPRGQKRPRCRFARVSAG